MDPNDRQAAGRFPAQVLQSPHNFAGLITTSDSVVIFLVIASPFDNLRLLTLGRVPIKLTILLVICAVVTVFQMIRSLFLKQQEEDPDESCVRTKPRALEADPRGAQASAPGPLTNRVTPERTGRLRAREPECAAAGQAQRSSSRRRRLEGFSQNAFGPCGPRIRAFHTQ